MAKTKAAKKKKRKPARKKPGSSPTKKTTPPEPAQARQTDGGQTPESARPGLFFWQKDDPMPKTFRKMRRQPMPCPKCRRVRLDDLGQAVIVTNSGRGVAWFRCRACDHRWALPVEEISHP